MVRGRAEASVESSVSHNTRKFQFGGSSSGAQGMGSHIQSVVEFPHGCARDFEGSIKGAEQAKEAIRDAPLGQIWVDHSREEAGGLQRDGHDTLGKSPNSETDPNYGSSAKMRCASELYRGHPRHFETHDNLEARLGGIQRPIEKNRVEYGRSSSNEC
ncbi:hypothetical protein SO802_032563 [Lithocarpus litseifolius]|uniref:Uncharacterized protein n=1 Tax=Lithocarpus litseifolius TaxID=425828 RepID=A0AAW2BC56_9ROSI